MTSTTPYEIHDEWCTVDSETRIQKQLDAMHARIQEQDQQLLHMQSTILQLQSTVSELQSTVNQLKSMPLHMPSSDYIKHMTARELNLALRTHVPIPFRSMPPGSPKYPSLIAKGLLKSPTIL